MPATPEIFTFSGGPKRKDGKRVSPMALVTAQVAASMALYHSLWSDLHRYALAYRGDRVEALAWLSAFDARVPSAGCSCRSHWTAWRRANPPDLADADTFFAWTVNAHNAVNVRLSKPTLSVDAARLLYA